MIYETTSLDDTYRGYESLFAPVKKNRYKGKENNMTLKIAIMGGSKNDYARAIKDDFSIDEPKFKVGDKVKVAVSNYSSYYGEVEKVESNIRIFKVKNASKYQRDENNWMYHVRKEDNNYIGTIFEKSVSKDDRPEYSKYFDFLDKQGVKLDRERYTWKSFRQEEFINLSGYVMASGILNQRDIHYHALLCDKFTGKEMKFEGKQTGTELLPSISKKC